MIQITKIIIVLCTLLQSGYFQENYLYQPSSVTGQHGQYSHWPFQTPTISGNYNPIPGPRRHKKPCTRRMNSNDLSSVDIQPQWIPTYTSRVVKPLEQNDVLFKSRSLEDKDFNSNPNTATSKVIEISTTTEKLLKENDSKKPEAKNGNICVTTTTTEEVAYRSPTSYDQVGPKYDYYDEVVDKHELNEYENDYKSEESLETISNDCNNRLEHGGNARRFLTAPVAFDNEQNVRVMNSNESDIKQDLKNDQNKNAIAPNLQADKDPLENQVNDRYGFYNVNASIAKPNVIGNKLMEPTNGRGISQLQDTKIMLMQNSKVCYACSSVSDPTCWKPDRRTTVKYCRVGHDSCVTKTIRNTNALIVIRDCAHSCDDTDVTGLIPRYKSCSICHYDLCNGAFNIKIYNVMLLSTFLALMKYSL